ncbi:MAG: DUF1178 family protein [Deltaproteobacteria bacterium]|nr:DUF1178 family protein [Deltaproteobacteria bacterium]
MIIYDLKCKCEHKFEGWFKDIQTFESQKAQKLIVCPVCQNTDVEIVLSSVAVMGKDGKDPARADDKGNSSVNTFQVVQEYLEKNFEDLGNRFAEVALKMHHGEEDRRNIKGTTTDREEEMLREEGVPFLKISLPKFDS